MTFPRLGSEFDSPCSHMDLSFNKRYFDGKITHGFVSLYTGRTIIFIASGLLGLFLPIFLYNFFNQNFQLTVVYYGIGYLFYGLIVALGAKFLNKLGFRRSLRISVIMGALFYTIFYFINQNNYFYLIPLSIIAVVLFRLFYWLPYNIDFAKFTDKANRGKELSALMAVSLVISIFTPMLAGFIITRFNYAVLFFIAIILFLVSGIPYITLPKTKEKFSWSLKETWKSFFSMKERRIMLAYMADGAESIVSIVVWPIFIFQVLKGNYLEIGAVSALIIGATAIIQLFFGKYVDKNKKEKIIHIGSILYSLGWLLKIFITTAFQIFIVGAYHNIVSIFIRTPFDTLTYEIAADQGHYVDEFTVLYEMALNAGRAIMAVFVIFISLFLALQWTFVLAAAAALFFNLLRAKDSSLLPRV